VKVNDFTADQARYFDQQARLLGIEEENFVGDYEFANVLAFLNLFPHSKILEFGCGTGRFSIKFLEKGFDVFGVDISSESLSKLRYKYKKKATLKWGNGKTAKKIPIGKKFDACVCINIIHHLEKPTDTIKEIKTCLKKKGIIYIFEPNPLYLPWYVYFASKGILPIEKNILKSSMWNIKKMLIQQGFKHVKTMPYGLFPTRLLFWSSAVLKFMKLSLSRLPVIRLFTFHNMLRAEN